MASVTFNNVSLTYKGSDRDVQALRDVSWEISDGEPVALIGPSGCGKSTSLLLAAGLMSPSSGDVLVGDVPANAPRRETALILQEYGLLPWKTVSQNAALGLTIRGMSKRESSGIVARALETVGLSDFARAYPGELSGGMRQRLALARAVALDADLLLMDEPLSALDSLTREDLQDMLLELWQRRGHTQILVTHSIEEAVYLGRRIILMTPRPGRIHAIVENPGMGEKAYRQSPDFFATCSHLRELLVEEGALRR